jgi:hypothetical protein
MRRAPSAWGRTLRLPVLLAAGISILAGSGCAGYKLGPIGDARAGNQSVQVNSVVNATIEPRLGAAVNQALRKAIQQDGTYRLNTRGDADLFLQVEIVRYHRRAIAYQANDTLSAEDYQLTLDAKVVATERRSGREVLQKEVTSRTTVRIGTDLASVERQALPLLANDLAHRVTVLLAEGAW